MGVLGSVESGVVGGCRLNGVSGGGGRWLVGGLA